MRIAALLLAALLVSPLPAVTKNLPLQAVKLFRGDFKGQARGCTAWYYRYKSGPVVALTNAHCVSDAKGNPLHEATFTIGGLKAELYATNVMRDLAALYVADVPFNQRTLDLATKQADFADHVTMIGYPAGYLLVSVGTVSNPALSWSFRPFPVAVYDFLGGPGSSGSPVLDSSGRVTGMLSFAFGPYSGGPTLADLRLFLHGV